MPGPPGSLPTLAPHPSHPPQGGARVSRQDVAGAGEPTAPTERPERRWRGWGAHPVPCPHTARPTPSSKGNGKIAVGRSHATAGTPWGRAARDNSLGGQRHPPGKRRPGRGWGVEPGFARLRCSPRALRLGGGKQRGLGGDVPEPRHAVNSHCRSSKSARSQRWAFVSWKPDGALPSASTARLATALSQAQALRDPGAAEHPALGPHWGGQRGGGAGRAPRMDGWCQGAPCPSRHRVCPKGCRVPKGCCVPRDAEGRQHPPQGIRAGALTSLKTPVYLCVLCRASVSLRLPNSRRLKRGERGWSANQSPPGPHRQG